MARTYDIGCDPNFHISFFTLTCTKGRITFWFRGHAYVSKNHCEHFYGVFLKTIHDLGKLFSGGYLNY